MYIYIYIHTYICIYIYIYIYCTYTLYHNLSLSLSIHIYIYIHTYLYDCHYVPQRRIRKEGSGNMVTFRCFKSVWTVTFACFFRLGSPFSDPPLGDSDIVLLLDSLPGSSANIGTTQIILAWPLRKDDTQSSRRVNHVYNCFTITAGALLARKPLVVRMVNGFLTYEFNINLVKTRITKGVLTN